MIANTHLGFRSRYCTIMVTVLSRSHQEHDFEMKDENAGLVGSVLFYLP